ncbi:MAG: hypothetical protein ACOCZH_04780 [Phototrophicaceae bacterium]
MPGSRKNKRSGPSLLQRIGRTLPREGEYVQIFEGYSKIAEGTVVTADEQNVTIAGRHGLIDLDTFELRRGLNDGSLSIRRPGGF